MLIKSLNIEWNKTKVNLFKLLFVFIYFLFYISINSFEIPEIDIRKILYNSNKIIYQGKKILKSKLLSENLGKVSNEYISDKIEEKKKFNIYYNLEEYSNNSKNQKEIKEKFFQEISIKKKTNVTQVNTFFLSYIAYFGNNLIALNNAIFYCEIIGCSKIVLNSKNSTRKWLIEKPIYIQKLNITIIQGDNINCNDNKTLCFYEVSWLIFYPKIVKTQIRIDLIKTEILKNLPPVNIEKNDLYIHIRGGNVFRPPYVKHYTQPPLCFYEKIIKYNSFKKIYIVSEDRANIVVNALINEFKNIIWKKNNIEYDISLLSHAYNLVLSVSSFAFSSIKLNDNLKELWEYDIMRLSEKFLFLHHHIFTYQFQYNIHTMKPSDKYVYKMFSWRGSSEQIELMLKDKCPFDFILTKKNI